MGVDFASIGERRGTGNLKWDRQGPLPFGVADMDVQTPLCVREALQRRLDHPYYGYAFAQEPLLAAITAYLRERHGVRAAEAAWLHPIPGCVPALSLVTRAFCREPGDAVMVGTPAYPPMLHCHEDARCRLVTFPHRDAGDHWEMDWDAMEAAVDSRTRVLLFCNPHNPLGRSWSEEELLRVADFCERRDLILCSDEIHADLVLEPGLRHHSALALPERYLARTVMLSAPSKTFNIAGLGFSYLAIPNPELRARVVAAQGCTLPTLSVFAYAAAEAAYAQGWGWHAELIEALRANRDFLHRFLDERLPQLRHWRQEATYLAWLDVSALGLEAPHAFFRREAGVFLDNGAGFGDPQAARLNFACSPEMLKQGLEAIAEALERRGVSR